MNQRKREMKRHIISLLAILVLPLMALAAPLAQGAYPVQKHDFGYIKEEKGAVSCTFQVLNTGDRPLVINQVRTACGCTRPEFTTKPISPGKKGKIKITFNPNGRPGAFRKTIKVYTNGVEKRTTLVITGTVIPKQKR